MPSPYAIAHKIHWEQSKKNAVLGKDGILKLRLENYGQVGHHLK
jgi:hypothetical protein